MQLNAKSKHPVKDLSVGNKAMNALNSIAYQIIADIGKHCAHVMRATKRKTLTLNLAAVALRTAGIPADTKTLDYFHNIKSVRVKDLPKGTKSVRDARAIIRRVLKQFVCSRISSKVVALVAFKVQELLDDVVEASLDLVYFNGGRRILPRSIAGALQAFSMDKERKAAFVAAFTTKKGDIKKTGQMVKENALPDFIRVGIESHPFFEDHPNYLAFATKGTR
jgi:histone H3/H4